MSELRIELPNLAATARLGACLAPLLVAGDLLLLDGEMGAGKTTLARAIGEGLRAVPPLASPTFVLATEHDGRLPVWHLDAYRLGEGSDPVALGLIDTRNEAGVTIVEWGERFSWDPGAKALRIALNGLGERRTVSIVSAERGRLASIASAARAAGLEVVEQ